MKLFSRMNWVAVGLCCVAAVLQPVASPWVTVALVGPALLIMAVGLGLVQREWGRVSEAVALEERWRDERRRCRGD